MSLHDQAVIVRLSISQWTARKFDKIVSAETAARYKADPDSGRWNKLLVAKEEIGKISQIATEARDYHYKNSVPWDDAGGRILPSENFLDYTKGMRVLKERFDQAWNTFVTERYDTLKEEAKTRLKGMFRNEDYPGKRDLLRKYGFSVDIEPVPSASDFRVTLSKRDMERVRKELDARVADKVSGVTRDLFQRLVEVINHFVEKVSEKDAIFRDSLIGNIEELVVLLPKLNVSNDAELTQTINTIKKKVLVYEPDSLRSDKDARKVAAKEAKAILDKMSGYLGKLK